MWKITANETAAYKPMQFLYESKIKALKEYHYMKNNNWYSITYPEEC
jgi:hypothetical protein